VDAAKKEPSLNLRQERREAWSNELRQQGIPVSWTVVHGQADEAIAARAAKSKSSLILFELHRSGRRMVDCPDGVVSATIRRAHCPVITVPAQFSGS
jgi:hypothetical protein